MPLTFYSLVLFTSQMMPVLAFHLFCFARQRLSSVSQHGYHHAVESANEQKTVNSVTCESVITPSSALAVCSVCSAQHIFQLITERKGKKKSFKKSLDLSFSRLFKIIVATASSDSVSLRKPVALFTAYLRPTEVFLDQQAKRCTSRSATLTAVRAEQLNAVLKNTGSVWSEALC